MTQSEIFRICDKAVTILVKENGDFLNLVELLCFVHSRFKLDESDVKRYIAKLIFEKKAEQTVFGADCFIHIIHS